MRQRAARGHDGRRLFPGTVARIENDWGAPVLRQVDDTSRPCVASKLHGTVLVLALRTARGFTAVHWALVTDGRVTGWLVTGFLRTCRLPKKGSPR